MPSGEPVRFTIESGVTSAKIGEILEEKGLVSNSMLFGYYLKYKKEGHRFQAGTYEMSPGIELDDIIHKLNNGHTVEKEMIRLTIPEGYHVRQIAKLIDEKGLDGAHFLKLIQEVDEDWGFPLLAQIPNDPDLKYRLEGYLFPDTYEWPVEEISEEKIIHRMVSELQTKLNQLPTDWEDRLVDRGLSFHELMTVASLIEREIAVQEEKPIVAGVIYNRLNIGQKLELDASVQYLFEEQRETVFYADLKIDDPYNTYRYNGLPPGPIASPSVESIRAALDPEETNYYFYVTKKDGSREHLFAETFEEHQKNIERSKQ